MISDEMYVENYNYAIRAAAKEKRQRIIRDCFSWVCFLTVCAVVLCALNGVWWPFWYITLPITAPLFLLYIAFDSGLSSLNAMPRMDIVVLLLMFILFNMQWRK